MKFPHERISRPEPSKLPSFDPWQCASSETFSSSTQPWALDFDMDKVLRHYMTADPATTAKSKCGNDLNIALCGVKDFNSVSQAVIHLFYEFPTFFYYQQESSRESEMPTNDQVEYTLAQLCNGKKWCCRRGMCDMVNDTSAGRRRRYVRRREGKKRTKNSSDDNNKELLEEEVLGDINLTLNDKHPAVIGKILLMLSLAIKHYQPCEAIENMEDYGYDYEDTELPELPDADEHHDAEVRLIMLRKDYMEFFFRHPVENVTNGWDEREDFINQKDTVWFRGSRTRLSKEQMNGPVARRLLYPEGEGDGTNDLLLETLVSIWGAPNLTPDVHGVMMEEVGLLKKACSSPEAWHKSGLAEIFGMDPASLQLVHALFEKWEVYASPVTGPSLASELDAMKKGICPCTRWESPNVESHPIVEIMDWDNNKEISNQAARQINTVWLESIRNTFGCNLLSPDAPNTDDTDTLKESFSKFYKATGILPTAIDDFELYLKKLVHRPGPKQEKKYPNPVENHLPNPTMSYACNEFEPSPVHPTAPSYAANPPGFMAMDPSLIWNSEFEAYKSSKDRMRRAYDTPLSMQKRMLNFTLHGMFMLGIRGTGSFSFQLACCDATMLPNCLENISFTSLLSSADSDSDSRNCVGDQENVKASNANANNSDFTKKSKPPKDNKRPNHKDSRSSAHLELKTPITAFDCIFMNSVADKCGILNCLISLRSLLRDDVPWAKISHTVRRHTFCYMKQGLKEPEKYGRNQLYVLQPLHYYTGSELRCVDNSQMLEDLGMILVELFNKKTLFKTASPYNFYRRAYQHKTQCPEDIYARCVEMFLFCVAPPKRSFKTCPYNDISNEENTDKDCEFPSSSLISFLLFMNGLCQTSETSTSKEICSEIVSDLVRGRVKRTLRITAAKSSPRNDFSVQDAGSTYSINSSMSMMELWISLQIMGPSLNFQPTPSFPFFPPQWKKDTYSYYYCRIDKEALSDCDNLGGEIPKYREAPGVGLAVYSPNTLNHNGHPLKVNVSTFLNRAYLDKGSMAAQLWKDVHVFSTFDIDLSTRFLGFYFNDRLFKQLAAEGGSCFLFSHLFCIRGSKDVALDNFFRVPMKRGEVRDMTKFKKPITHRIKDDTFKPSPSSKKRAKSDLKKFKAIFEAMEITDESKQEFIIQNPQNTPKKLLRHYASLEKKKELERRILEIE
eukprot:Nk52_evm4s263 gene=Nk52_evmTU4s263